MESGLQISLPIKTGAKKIRKRRELDALVSYSIARRNNISKPLNPKGKHSLEKLIRTSTDDQEDCNLETNYKRVETCHVRNSNVPIRICAPLIVVIVIIISFGFVHWLYFDLRQQFVEYRQKIEEVSVISQNLPEEMQKWHEKSSFLEKNQSIIYEKLNEIQIAIESLKTNFTKYAARADSRNEYSKDDKFVADLGAKLEAVASDMEIIKDHFTTVQKNQSILQEDIDKLGVRFNDISNHIPEKSKDEDVCLQKVQSLQTRYENEIKSVTANISIVNDTLTQKSGIISDELLVHKTKIDDLMDKTANITSHVSSIKNDWTKYKQQIVDCDAKVENFENSMSQIVNKTNILEKSIQEVRLNCSLSDGLGRNCINLTDTTPQINKTNGLNVK
ncbi:uncharacterized protein LOC129952259 isoform X1 [Eupeodes corollae]|uniref:uncharacterized protein LOC129952259 isoform X1 n=1 Tax=Eupeodes corollae TaxID=290404 RepID=UPI00248F5FDF|nr:uncharacterized protein LOC129952259 isoform X1 [Eupeodes corollae]